MAEHIQISDVTPRVQYTANGSQTVFTFPFPIFQDADLAVYIDDAVQTVSADFTVLGAGDSAGGTVTFLTAPSDGATVTVLRSIAIERTTDFQDSGEFRAKVINDELDTIVASTQELRDGLSRTLRLSGTDVAATLVLPDKSARSSKVLAFDAGGNVTVSNDDLGEMEGAASNAAAASASAASAAASATDAAASAVDASASAVDAATSATAAAASAASNLFARISRKAASDSPYTVTADTEDGTLFTLEDDGVITVNLPSIAAAGEGERYGFLRIGPSHAITLARNGSDTINGVAGDYALSLSAGEIVILVADDATPDNWIVVPWTQATAGPGLSKSGSAISLNLAADNTWTGPQRSTFVTQNSGEFDMDAGQNFTCTPADALTLRFTNEANGQSGVIVLDNTGGHIVTLGSECEADSAFAAEVSNAGKYPIGYICYDGTNVILTRGLGM